MPNKREVLVRDIMSSRPIHVNENDPVSLVISLFERAHISGAPVVNDKGFYVGVLSKTDLAGSKLVRLVQAKGYDKVLAREVMSPQQPLTVDDDFPVRKAIELMLDRQVHRIFVKDGTDKIVGVVSSFDVMRVIELPNVRGEASTDDKKALDREMRFFSLVSQKQGEMMVVQRRPS